MKLQNICHKIHLNNICKPGGLVEYISDSFPFCDEEGSFFKGGIYQVISKFGGYSNLTLQVKGVKYPVSIWRFKKVTK